MGVRTVCVAGRETHSASTTLGVEQHKLVSPGTSTEYRRPSNFLLMSRYRILLLSCTLLSCAGTSMAQDAAVFADIATIVSADKTTTTQVRVHGVVTCAEANSFFVQDGTGALQVAIDNAGALVNVGDAVETSGILMRAGTELQLHAGQVLKRGTQAVPDAPHFGNNELLRMGRPAHGRRVNVAGSVQDVALVLDEVRLQVWNYNAPIVVAWRLSADDPSRRRPDDLLDAIIDATGVAQLDGVASRSGITAVKVVLASRNNLHVVTPGSPDIFKRPLRTLKSLRGPVAPQADRFRIIGTVSYASPFGQIYVQDGTGAGAVTNHHLLDLSPEVRRPSQPNLLPQAGDLVEAVGSAYHQPSKEEKFMPALLNAEWRVLSHGSPPHSQPVLASKMMEGGADGQSISITGTIMGFEVKHQPYGEIFTHALTLDDNGVGFVVYVHGTKLEHMPFTVGDYVRVNGVAKLVQNTEGAVSSFYIQAKSLEDVQGASAPWRREVVMRWVIGLGAVALAALVWVILLRRQVHLQTARLREANEKLTLFKALMDSATDMISLVDMEVSPQYVNPAGRAMLGIGPDEPASVATTESIFAPASAARIMEVGIPHALATGNWSGEIEMQHRDGHTIPVSFVGLVVKDADGKPLCMGCIARDISDRKAMEQQLRDANLALERFKAIVDTTSDFVGMATLDRKTVLINPAGRTLLGIGQDEDVTSIMLESIYTAETMERFQSEFVPALMAHGVWQGEADKRHRDGHAIRVSMVGSIVNATDGTPTYLCCVSRDLSARIAMEEKLRDSLDKERDLNQLKSSFVNTISHEFRTPLGIILFASSMMERFNESFTAEERAEQLRDIQYAVGRMNDLVEQTLCLGRAEAAQPEKHGLNINSLCTRIVDEVHSAAAHRSPIAFEADGALPLASSDETMLRAIIVNLLTNAVKYSPPGTQVELRVVRDEGNAILIVRDHGPGLQEQDLPKLFTSFHRGRGTVGFVGSGLGLAIVKRCSEALDGSVVARNADGGGAEFTVVLPHFFPPS